MTDLKANSNAQIDENNSNNLEETKQFEFDYELEGDILESLQNEVVYYKKQ